MAVKYPVATAVIEGCRHCATISRLKFNAENGRGLPPLPGEKTGTVTFVEFEGRTYAVTAGHVIKTFDDARRQEGNSHEGYFCPKEPGVAILGPFLTPPKDFAGRRPDVAISPVDPRLPGRIGKLAFVVEREGDALYPVTHAVATGYPTAAKADVPDKVVGERLKMSCVQALAEGVGSGDGDQVQFFSELSEVPESGSLSGMSGGPVFWSTDQGFGLLGFVKEALDVTPVEGEETIYSGPRVHFICQRVDYQTLGEWFAFIDATWQKERDKIAAAVSAVQA